MEKGQHSLPKVGTVLNKFLVMRWKRDRARIIELERQVMSLTEVKQEVENVETEKDNTVVGGVHSYSGSDPLLTLLVD